MKEDALILFLLACYSHAEQHSDDLSNQNAAIVFCPDECDIYGIGANSLPKGVIKTDERIKARPKKYAYIEHAERNAIYAAAKAGRCTKNCVMVCPWFACADCARAIVQSGIRKVYGHKQRMDMTNVGREKVADTVDNRWVAPVTDGDIILQEAGIETYYYDGPMPEPINILINEQRITAL